MAGSLSVGDQAPEFDLASTEDVVLMLRDEVPRTAVVLYLFGDPAGERERRDLVALARAHRRLAESRAVVLAVSPAKLDDLKAVQRDLKLPFALLHDDRGFSRDYGVAPAAEGAATEPALFLVNRLQRVIWLANPVASVDEAIEEVAGELSRLPSQTSNYPKSIVNRLVDRWVN